LIFRCGKGLSAFWAEMISSLIYFCKSPK
jgi:hypothetical protein